MTLSIADLPLEDGCLMPGKWLVHMRDPFNDGFGGAQFRNGITIEPVDTRQVQHLVACLPVIGALRVDGGLPHEIGDCSALRPGPTADELAAEAEAKAKAESEALAAKLLGEAEEARLAAEAVAAAGDGAAIPSSDTKSETPKAKAKHK